MAVESLHAGEELAIIPQRDEDLCVRIHSCLYDLEGALSDWVNNVLLVSKLSLSDDDVIGEGQNVWRSV